MRWCRQEWMKRQVFQIFFLTILTILILVGLHALFLVSLGKPETIIRAVSTRESNRLESVNQLFFIPIENAPDRHFHRTITNTSKSKLGNSTCGMHSCFDLFRCGQLGENKLSIYIYPVQKLFINGKQLQKSFSKEFYEIIEAILKSPYYVSDPDQACIFVPTIDLLNLQRFIAPPSPDSPDLDDLERTLESLDFWGKDGSNHLLFNMFPGPEELLFRSRAAIVAASAFSADTFRLGFHIPIISYNSESSHYKPNHLNVDHSSRIDKDKKPLCVSAQGFIRDNFTVDEVLVLNLCKHDPFNYSIRCKGDMIYKYPDVLTVADYCLVLGRLSHLLLWDILRAGCVPVIVPHHQRLPFDDFIDWRRNSIILYEHQLYQIGSILRRISSTRYRKLKSQVQFTFSTYFASMGHVTRTVLEVIKERVFPHNARTVYEWNHNPEYAFKVSPIFNPVIAPKAPGFTAVILAYDRVPSLFQVIERVALVPSLSKVLIIWNNQNKKPPSADLWPKISKPFKVIQTSKNQMSNRFYPYDEIETEAVFSLDDDIVMLTVDEMEFGFETWREFSDRIVGFPSRSHVWDNSSQKWKYESVWKNEISMVLTGAAFYHKFWHYAYTFEMPGAIRDWVDQRMNCEDIAMNFLVANITGKSPIKVTPRKKFKCPTCSNNEMLSTDTGHMMERTDCINEFSRIYGHMPLIPVEFRADPVLFKVENLPNKLKRFKDIGSL